MPAHKFLSNNKEQHRTRMHHWLLILFTSHDKTQIARVYRFRTISGIASVVNETTTVVSNTVHRLILPRGTLRYCEIRKVMSVTPHAGRRAKAARQLGQLP